ncbi:CAP domain-containing protein, partial [Acinetobacter baumannii]
RSLIGCALAAGAAVSLPVNAAVRPLADVDAYFDRLNRRNADAGGGRFIGQAEDLLLPEHNQFRARSGLGALRRHAELDAAARAHAADMI